MLSKIKIVVSYLCLAMLGGTTFAQPKADTIRVFYLGGQSNMEGYGKSKELPKTLSKKFDNVYIFHGNPTGDNHASGGLGKWENLRPGHGTGFSSDKKTNTISDHFGIELSFAQRMSELYPNQKIALIKYARNGSSIDSSGVAYFGSWEPDYNGQTGINQYDYFLKTVRDAMAVADINADGRTDILIPSGIIWMQGESDADKTAAIANNYYQNLKRLMDLMRAALRTDDLPVVLGKISDSGDEPDGKVWPFGELVQYGQEQFAATDKSAIIVRSTSKYSYSDKYHYDSTGYIDLGKEFANALFKISKHK